MKTYPHATDDGIIELVRKDEHDTIVVELLSRLEERTQSHIHASARDVQTIQRQSVLLDRLATALDALIHDCTAHAKDIQKIRWGYDGDGGSKLSAEQIEECCDAASQAIAAYESAKSGNLPDPLVEAVKRMGAVSLDEMAAAWANYEPPTLVGSLKGVRARLIQAAKGEQS